MIEPKFRTLKEWLYFCEYTIFPLLSGFIVMLVAVIGVALGFKFIFGISFLMSCLSSIGCWLVFVLFFIITGM